jgi:hypothetical protein
MKKKESDSPKLHFNKGQIGRFREVMSEDDLDLSRKVFGLYLKKMGYE